MNMASVAKLGNNKLKIVPIGDRSSPHLDPNLG